MSAARKVSPATSGPKRSPWGRVQDCKIITFGIWSVSTASHGGLKLDPKANACVHEAWRRAVGWYEEDCEWAIVALTFPDAFEAHLEHARSSAKDWYPDAYSRVFGVSVPPSESHVLRERAARAAARGKLQITACWGDWATNVPAGHVGVYAVVDGHEAPRGTKGAFYTLTSEEYEGTRRQTVVHFLPEGAVLVAAEDNGPGPFRGKT